MIPRAYGFDTVEPVPEVTLRVVREGITVYLAAVDPRTGCMLNQGRILEIESDGTLRRCGSINRHLGLALDREDKIIISH